MQHNGEALLKGLLLRSCVFLLIVGEMCRVSAAQDRFSLRLNVSSSPAAPTLLIYFSLIYFLALFLYRPVATVSILLCNSFLSMPRFVVLFWCSLCCWRRFQWFQQSAMRWSEREKEIVCDQGNLTKTRPGCVPHQNTPELTFALFIWCSYGAQTQS